MLLKLLCLFIVFPFVVYTCACMPTWLLVWLACQNFQLGCACSCLPLLLLSCCGLLLLSHGLPSYLFLHLVSNVDSQSNRPSTNTHLVAYPFQTFACRLACCYISNCFRLCHLLICLLAVSCCALRRLCAVLLSALSAVDLQSSRPTYCRVVACLAVLNLADLLFRLLCLCCLSHDGTFVCLPSADCL